MKKFLSAILAVTTVFTALAVFACTPDDEPPVQEPAEEESTTISLIGENNEAAYVLYRPEEASEDASKAGQSLQTIISERCGVAFEYTTDSAESVVEGKGELLIGNTSRQISKTAATKITETQFRLYCENGALAIVAGNDELLALAVQTFADEYITESGIVIPNDLDRIWECEAVFNTYEVANPINEEGDDPYVTYHNGMYYYCWSANRGVRISKADSLEKITKDGGIQAYKAPSTGMYSKEYWAPELHYIDGAWYIYVAADDGNDVNHRMYVMKCEDEDPTAKEYGFEFVGKITDPSDKWAIDGTILYVGEEMYFVWSGWAGDNDPGNQKLYIAHMSNPWTIDSDRIMISYPSNSWESPLNEGPIAVYNGDDIYIVYSASGSWSADYCLGYLKLKPGQDPMKARSWEKAKEPILKRDRVANGPGHCSVATAPDGSQWVIYHANLPKAPVGWEGRSVWIQKLEFADDGSIKTMKNTKTVNFPTTFDHWKVKKEVNFEIIVD